MAAGQSWKCKKKFPGYEVKLRVFCTFNFDQLPFLSPLSYEEVTFLLRKPHAMPIESKPDTG